MRPIKTIILSIIVLTILGQQTAMGSVLIDRLNANELILPFELSGSLNDRNYPLATISNSTIHGQAIYLEDSWGGVEAIQIIVQRASPYDPNTERATLTLRVYRSTYSTISEVIANKVLWETCVFSPTTLNTQTQTCTFDADITVTNPAFGYKVNNYMWVELQETYEETPGCGGSCGIIPNNELFYGNKVSVPLSNSYGTVPTDSYEPSELMQYDGASWTTIESHFTNPAYRDLSFKIFGSFHIPQTPDSTPQSNPSMTPGDTPQPAPGGTAPAPGTAPGGVDTGGVGFNNGSGTGDNTPCVGGTAACNGTLPTLVPCTDSLQCGTLTGLGYDTNNDGQITLDEIINAAYDFSVAAFILSWLGIFISRRAKR